MRKHIFLIIGALILGACARVGSPGGGDKDTTPPTFVRANIDTTRVNVPTKTRELRLEFSEYIMLKDVQKNLVISPPIKKIKKIIPSNLSTKFIQIQWEEDLMENTTYNFNFGNAIVDNNEGNALPYFNFAFSTGDKIDNLYLSGEVKDALQSVNTPSKKSVVIGLYKDSVEVRQKPHYITKADDDGYFELNYLSSGDYRLLAFEDENENSLYDEGKEKVGFLKEKVQLSESISGLKLSLYPSRKEPKYLEAKPIAGGVLLQFEGNPQKVEVQSMSEELKSYQVSHQPLSDSVKIWIGKEGNALKTDVSTALKFSYSIDSKKDTISTFYKINEKDELSLANTKSNVLPPRQAFIITANMDIKDLKTAQWVLKMDSIRQDFKAEISEKTPNDIKVIADFKAGKKYTLSVPKESVNGYFEKNKKAYVFNFEVDKAENYGSLVLKLKAPLSVPFWVQLTDKEGKVKYSQYITTTNASEIKFTEIVPAVYNARILVDSNQNKTWDNADFKANTAAEPAHVFSKEIEIRKMWEIVEDWTLE